MILFAITDFFAHKVERGLSTGKMRLLVCAERMKIEEQVSFESRP